MTYDVQAAPAPATPKFEPQTKYASKSSAMANVMIQEGGGNNDVTLISNLLTDLFQNPPSTTIGDYTIAAPTCTKSDGTTTCTNTPKEASGAISLDLTDGIYNIITVTATYTKDNTAATAVFAVANACTATAATAQTISNPYSATATYTENVSKLFTWGSGCDSKT